MRCLCVRCVFECRCVLVCGSVIVVVFLCACVFAGLIVCVFVVSYEKLNIAAKATGREF